MPTITTKDGAAIFYKDWGTGRPVVFSHGWPLNADAWDPQLNMVAGNGYRAIARDRWRRWSRPQPWPRTEVILRAAERSAYRILRTNVSSWKVT
jgi:non-heme chloroperoxidase